MTGMRLGWLGFDGVELAGGPPGVVPLSLPGPGGLWSHTPAACSWRGRGSAARTRLPRRWGLLVPWDLAWCQLSSQELTS